MGTILVDENAFQTAYTPYDILLFGEGVDPYGRFAKNDAKNVRSPKLSKPESVLRTELIALDEMEEFGVSIDMDAIQIEAIGLGEGADVTVQKIIEDHPLLKLLFEKKGIRVVTENDASRERKKEEEEIFRKRQDEKNAQKRTKEQEAFKRTMAEKYGKEFMDGFKKSLQALSEPAKRAVVAVIKEINFDKIVFKNPRKAVVSSSNRGSFVQRDDGGLDYIPDNSEVGVFPSILLRDPTEDEWHINAKKVLNGRQIDSNVSFKPVAAMDVQEILNEDEDTETYTIFLPDIKDVQETPGLALYCPSSETYSFIEFKQMSDPGFMFPLGVRKPVIYLYPEQETMITVGVDFKGTISNSYPLLENNQWKVKVRSDGLIDYNAKQYRYLFWDGLPDETVQWDLSKSFCVLKKNVEVFLEDVLSKFGLSSIEMQDFITYWAPMMKTREWVQVSFPVKQYEDISKLDISPKPDSVIRVYMIFKGLDRPVDVSEPEIEGYSRKGFVVVEWGGTNLDEMI